MRIRRTNIAETIHVDTGVEFLMGINSRTPIIPMGKVDVGYKYFCAEKVLIWALEAFKIVYYYIGNVYEEGDWEYGWYNYEWSEVVSKFSIF